jgi:kinesin family member 11
VAELLETVVRESQEYVQTERRSLLEAKAHSDAATSAEIVRLQEQNVLLMKLLESEKQKSEKAKDLLIARISGLLGEFTADRDKSLRETFSEMRERNVIGEGEMEKCGRENGERIVGVIRAGEDWSGSLMRRGTEGKRLRDGAIKVR